MTTIDARPGTPPPLVAGESVDADHQVLRSNAAVVDLSDVSFVHVSGPGAQDAVQDLFTRDIEFLTPERSITGLLLDEAARPVDVVSCFVHPDGDGVVLRTGFGAGATVIEHLRAHVGPEVEVTELALDAIGIEGPYAWSAVGEVLDPDLASLPFESVMPITWEGHELVFSRTGVTGEYGYQLVGEAAAIDALRNALAGSAEPVGRAAVEVAMLEVRQPLLDRELADGVGVVAAGLQWLVDITKPDFLGRDALEAERTTTSGSHTIGGEIDAPAEVVQGADVVAGDEVVGTVVWAVHSPGRGATLALARVRPDLVASGLCLGVRTPEGVASLTTLSSPYVIPASWSVPIL